MSENLMNFENEKYEYLLHTWGEFYNKKHVECEYSWFESASERNNYLDKLKQIANKLNVKLACSFEEGRHVRYKTIAKMILVYNGKQYPYSHDFGYGYPVDAAYYTFEEGNYSCDCNRSIFLRETYGENIKELDCGETIKALNFIVTQEK